MTNHHRDWNINTETERKFWTEPTPGTFIELPKICPYCRKGAIGLKKTENINAPFQGKCNYYKCTRNLNLRKDTIFGANAKTPVSVLYKIIKYWLVDSLNAKNIEKKSLEDYGVENVDMHVIYSLLFSCRQLIATHLKNVYSLDRLSNEDDDEIICVDESLFTHNSHEQQWVVGLINISTNEIRLELVENRNEETLKKIIEKHVGYGNTIYTDSWSGYNFLDRQNSGYRHNVANHNEGIFGLTSRIEGIWGEIKAIIKILYVSIHSIHFVYFIKEAEYRRSIKNMSVKEKINDFVTILSTIGPGNYLTEENLLTLDYSVMYDD